MIDTNKLLPRSSASTLNPRSISDLGIIRSDSKKIDDLLKERLVLSKVRYGIERQRLERERRKNRETNLESDTEQDYEIGSDLSKDDLKRRDGKPKKGLGLFMGTVLRTAVSSIGGLAFAAMPRFTLINDKVRTSGTNFNRTIGGTDGLLNSVKSQRGPFNKLRKIDLKPVRNIGRTITGFGNSLQFFVTSAIAGQVSGRALDKLRAPAQVKAQVAQQARVQQRATSGVRVKSRAGVRAGQIDIEEALELRRSQENARARQRANVMRRQQEMQAEAAAETAVKKRRRKKLNLKDKQLDIFERKFTAEDFESSFVRRQARIQKEIFGDSFNTTTTATLDPKEVLRNNFLRNTFILDENDARRLGFKINKDEVFERGNVRLGNFDMKGQSFYYIDKNNIDFQQYLHARYGKSYKGLNLDFTNKEFADSLSIFELESNLGKKAQNIAAQDMLLDRIRGRKRSDLNVLDFIDEMKARDGGVIRPEGDRSFGRPTGFDARGKPFYQTKGPKGMRRSDVTSSGRVGSRVFTKPDGTVIYRSGGLTSEDLFTNAGQRSTQNMFRNMPTQIRNVDLLDAAGEKSTKNMFKNIDKIKPQKVVGKKGLGKFMASIGGAQFLKPIKKFLGETIGAIPLIGDLIAFLIDIFVFGEPPGRAGFMAIGSILGGFLGGLAGSIGGPPGALIGGIIGGIGGDLLGGAFYDLLFRGGGTDFGERVPKSVLRSGVKAGLATGGYANMGKYMLGEQGKEFVMDADSTKSIDRKAPGFLMALNKASAAEVSDVLNSYASYEGTAGRERLVPVPIPSVTNSTPPQTIVITTSSGQKAQPFSQHYRRG